MERNRNEFAPEESMIRKMKERIGKEDVVFSAVESLMDHMNELAGKRDETSDVKFAEIIDETLDKARIKINHLLLQMSGIIDNARTVLVSEETIKKVSGDITEIEGLLNTAEKFREDEGDGRRKAV